MPAPVTVAMTMEQCWHRVPGGTATAALGLARALQARPDEVVVTGVAARHRAPAPEAFAPPVPVRHLPLPRAALYESWHALRRPTVQRATGPVDVVHAPTIIVPPAGGAALVVTLHDLAWRHEPGHFTARGVRFFERGLALARRRADLVLCSSRATMADAEAAGLPAARLRHVPLGVDVVPAAPGDVERVRRTYGLGRPFVLWVGTLEPRKNLANLLAAEARLGDDHDLVLVGPEGWGTDVAALLGDLGDRVAVLGFVPPDDLRALYAAATVFCYPSLREGFGLPVAEAMAQGTPVVTSQGTSTEEVAGGAALLVDPRDPATIAEALAAALADEGLRARLGTAGRARAAELSWGACAVRTVAAYRELAR